MIQLNAVIEQIKLRKNQAILVLGRTGTITIILFVLFNVHSVAQERNKVLPDSSLLAKKGALLEASDTLIMSSFTLLNIWEQNPYMDSVLHNRFAQYNPIFEQITPYLNLGNLGSSTIRLSQFNAGRAGLDFGFHQFDPYRKSLDEFEWYRTNIPFTDLYFAAGKSNPEFRVKSKFSMNFPGGLNFNIDFERIFDEGYYQNQSVKHSSLATGFWHSSKNKKSNTFVSYLTNRNQEENNGGITSDSLFSDSIYAIRLGMPVVLNESLTRHQQNQFSLRNFYRIYNRIDTSSGQTLFQLQLSNQLLYESGFYKFYDENTSGMEDSLYYDKLWVDPIGLRNFTSYQRFSYTPEITFQKTVYSYLKLGITYDRWWVINEPLAVKNYQDISWYTDLSLQFLKKFKLETHTAFHFADFAGDYRFESKLSYGSKYVKLFASQKIVNYSPTLLQTKLYLTEVKVFENNFETATTYTTVAGFSIPLLGFSTNVKYQLFNKYIYYEPETFFVQNDVNVYLVEIQLSENFRYKWLHFDNSVFFYKTDATFLDLPQYYISSKLYAHTAIFKNRLMMDTGFELYFTDGFYLPTYNPAIGVFHKQAIKESEAYPLLNFYISFKVDDFRFFARTENILNILTGKIQYQAFLYPQDDFKVFRIGVRWQFVN